MLVSVQHDMSSVHLLLAYCSRVAEPFWSDVGDRCIPADRIVYEGISVWVIQYVPAGINNHTPPGTDVCLPMGQCVVVVIKKMCMKKKNVYDELFYVLCSGTFCSKDERGVSVYLCAQSGEEGGRKGR